MTLAYQLRVRLIDVAPSVWRRFTVSGELHARDLTRVVRIVMGWNGSHMDGVHFPRAAPYKGRPLLVWERLLAGESFNYTYDFGDCWRHALEVESVSAASEIQPPRVVAGERACPPDDCGGTKRYAQLLESLADAEGSGGKQPEILRWLSSVSPRFDPAHVDQRPLNLRLTRLKLNYGIQRARRRGHRRGGVQGAMPPSQ